MHRKVDGKGRKRIKGDRNKDVECQNMISSSLFADVGQLSKQVQAIENMSQLTDNRNKNRAGKNSRRSRKHGAFTNRNRPLMRKLCHANEGVLLA